VSGCPRRRSIQDFLDHELAEPQAELLRRHLEGCADCAAEAALYRRAFRALDRLALHDPPPALAGQVLERVLPSRVRRRWVARVGWSYAASLAASMAGAALWLTRPGARQLLDSLSAVASRRLVESVTFVLDALAFGVVSLANGWGQAAMWSARLAPLMRALEALMSQPAIRLALLMAGITCAVVLWWMRPRDQRSVEGIRHVGVLGF
jgi:anti-sigma factor RsiW